MKDQMLKIKINKFESIEQMNLLNYIFSDDSDSKTSENEHLYDSFAVENSCKWIKTYNDFMNKLGIQNDDFQKSFIMEEQIKDKYKYFKKEFYNEKKHSKNRDFFNIRDKNYMEKTKSMFKDKKFMKKLIIKNNMKKIKIIECYLDLYRGYLYNYIPGYPLWNNLIPSEIRSIITDGSLSYRSYNDFPTVYRHYDELNKIFRSKSEKIVKNKIKKLDNYVHHFINICKMMIFPVSLSYDLFVYRYEKSYEIDEYITTSEFYSCSLSFDRVRRYNDIPDSGRMIKIKIPSGQKFLIVNSFSEYDNEIILMPSTFLRINGYEKIESSLLFEYVVERTYEMDVNIIKLLMQMESKTILKIIVNDVKNFDNTEQIYKLNKQLDENNKRSDRNFKELLDNLNE